MRPRSTSRTSASTPPIPTRTARNPSKDRRAGPDLLARRAEALAGRRNCRPQRPRAVHTRRVDWRERFAAKGTTSAQAIGLIPKGKRIFIGSGAAEPVGLVEELVAQAPRFADNPILHILTMGPAPYAEARYQDAFRHQAFFIGANVRTAVHEGRADYVPVFLSRIPELIRRRRTPVDVALVQVTPPDRFGFVNLGVSVDI